MRVISIKFIVLLSFSLIIIASLGSTTGSTTTNGTAAANHQNETSQAPQGYPFIVVNLPPKQWKMPIIGWIGICILLFIIGVFVGIGCNRWAARKAPFGELKTTEVDLVCTKLAPSFTYEDLLTATNNFSDSNLLGTGGFGAVHRGVLSNGTEVAVKSLKVGSIQGDREFQTEVEMISRVHHQHVVSLIGYCKSGRQRMLVYEFVPNSTLEFHLHGHPKIIHRDIKASNILVDFNFDAQVADFGLARFASDTNTHVSTRVLGTLGYLAPDYASSGRLSDKSDVFSFGVILLELITGRVAIDPNQPFIDDTLAEWARPLLWRALKDGVYDALIDPKLQQNYNREEMQLMVACAAACVHRSARRRPRMSQVVRALEGNTSLLDLNDDSVKDEIETKKPRVMAYAIQDLKVSEPQDQSIKTAKTVNEEKKTSEAHESIITAIKEDEVKKLKNCNQVEKPLKLQALEESPYYHKLNPNQLPVLSLYFERATTVSTPWRVKLDEGPNKGHYLCVFAKTLEALIHNESLESDLLQYTIYKLTKAYQEEQLDKNAKRKYMSVLLLDPSGWFYVSRYMGAATSAVCDPIMNMDKSVERILIPMCHGENLGSHWTLLIYCIKQMQFIHCNSLESNKDMYKKDAEKMANYCLISINNFLVKHQKKQVSRVVLLEYPTPQQGSSPDCLLYVRYFMKKFSKYDFDQYRSLGDPQQFREKMQKKRVSLSVKLLTANPPEESWNPAYETHF